MELDDQTRRGLVNLVTYGIDLRHPVDQDTIEQLCADILHERTFKGPPEKYYQAMSERLELGEPIGFEDEVDQEVARDFLTRLVETLDARRPWPTPIIRELRPHERPDLDSLQRIAIVPMNDVRLGNHLGMSLVLSDSPGALFVRLRTGETIAFTTFTGENQQEVSVSTDAKDAESAIENLRQLADLDVNPL